MQSGTAGLDEPWGYLLALCLDLWARQWRSRYAHGQVIMVRYPDDLVLGFHASGAVPSVQGSSGVALASYR
jgi:hypothetical protein